MIMFFLRNKSDGAGGEYAFLRLEKGEGICISSERCIWTSSVRT